MKKKSARKERTLTTESINRFDSYSACSKSPKRLEFTRSPDKGRHGVETAPAVHNLKFSLPDLLQERVFLVSDKPVQ